MWTIVLDESIMIYTDNDGSNIIHLSVKSNIILLVLIIVLHGVMTVRGNYYYLILAKSAVAIIIKTIYASTLIRY